jgi:DNA polymerase-3 subunit gamma/tau
MLSGAAFNALLKTLEEPPPRVVFIMATTERHKVPETILSRCQQFEFRTIASRTLSTPVFEAASISCTSIERLSVISRQDGHCVGSSERQGAGVGCGDL